MTPEDALKLASELASLINDRRGEVQTNVNYLKGREGRMRFASEQFKDYFQKRFEGFSDNWCSPVAQATVERMKYRGIRLEGSVRADDAVSRRWERNEADRGLAEALMMMTAAKRSFALVTPTAEGARITFENPDSVAVTYDPITRRRKAGLAVWQDDRFEYAQLHLPNSVLRMRREKFALFGGARTNVDVSGWEFDESLGDVEEQHGLGAVALVEFKNQALLDDDPISDIAGVRAMQDSINLVWAYILNILDYASLPGRAILGGEVIRVPILDDKGQVVGSKPIDMDLLIRERMMHVPAGKDGKAPQIGEWAAADPAPLAKIIEQAVAHVAAQTRTPGHYLLTKSEIPATGYELSEAGLVSKVEDRILFANAPLREVNRLAALADGERGQAEQISSGKLIWRKPQYRSEAQLWDGVLKLRQSGFPFQWIAEELDLPPDEVARIMEMRRAEAAEAASVDLAFLEPSGGVPASPSAD